MKPSDRIRFYVLLLGTTIGVCVLLVGCGSTSIVWSMESKSPDGTLIAQARTSASGGFGTAAPPVTFVYLKLARSSWSPLQILSFENPTAYPVGVTAVKMRWVTNSHLDVTYSKPAKLVFQAVKAGRVQITTHQVSQ